jgi:hypothetical protein
MSKDPKLPPDESEEKPAIDLTKLPSPDAAAAAQQQAPHSISTNARICTKCGQEGRVVRNGGMKFMYCNPCKVHWPVGPAHTPAPVPVASEARGFHKQTLLEPDWGLAYQDDDDESEG